MLDPFTTLTSTVILELNFDLVVLEHHVFPHFATNNYLAHNTWDNPLLNLNSSDSVDLLVFKLFFEAVKYFYDLTIYITPYVWLLILRWNSKE